MTSETENRIVAGLFLWAMFGVPVLVIAGVAVWVLYVAARILLLPVLAVIWLVSVVRSRR